MSYKHNKDLTEYAKSLRKNMTKEERRLWYDFLSGYPVRFLRQKVIDNYIADFYCRDAGLVIELDGSQHGSEDAREYDQIRTERLGMRGLTVLRIPNRFVNNSFSSVCYNIDLIVKELIAQKNSESNKNK